MTKIEKKRERDFKFDRYGLTKDGQVINLDMECLQLAKNMNTYVTLFQHRNSYTEE